MATQPISDAGQHVIKLLENMGYGVIRRTDRHWRVLDVDPVMDLEFDEEKRVLRLMSSKLCTVPMGITEVVQAFCRDLDSPSSEVHYLMEGQEVFCCAEFSCDKQPALNVLSLGKLVQSLQAHGRSFFDQLVGRCLDDLVVRIHQPENEYERTHLKP